jgi:homocysteine S-methyltransferase
VLARQETLCWIGPGTIVIDGGLSTELEAQGCQLGSSLWTAQALIDDPGLIESAHIAFVEAGAKILITSSYQLSRQGFLENGMLAEQADEALAESIEVAKRARGDRDVLIAASVGPYGAILHDGSEYRGNYGLSLEELIAFHRERVEVLVAAEPDLLAIETIPDLLEVEALVSVLSEYPNVSAWLSFTLGPDGNLWAGQSVKDAALVALSSPQVCAVGVNCVDPELVDSALRELRELTDLPLVVYANGGGTWNAESGLWEGAGNKPLTEYAQSWKQYEPLILGGCCGTDAGDIRQLSAATD